MNWIKTKDRFPEPFEKVLIWRGSTFQKAYYDGDDWILDNGGITGRVDYWMAIDPPGYKEADR